MELFYFLRTLQHYSLSVMFIIHLDQVNLGSEFYSWQYDDHRESPTPSSSKSRVRVNPDRPLQAIVPSTTGSFFHNQHPDSAERTGFTSRLPDKTLKKNTQTDEWQNPSKILSNSGTKTFIFIFSEDANGFTMIFI